MLTCYMPNTITAFEQLAISFQNDTVNVMCDHHILSGVRKVLDKLNKKLGELQLQLDTDNGRITNE